MEQNHRKKLAILPERDNRHVRKRDDIADFGIEMEIDRGYSSAARFMERLYSNKVLILLTFNNFINFT